MLEKNINLDGKTILVTGAAGFIGANLCCMLLEKFKDVILVGIDSMNDYYDVSLKEYRLAQIKEVQKNSSGIFIFVKGNIADFNLVKQLFCKYTPNLVVNLAAQAGVRYSITNPDAYIEANVMGFYNILDSKVNGKYTWYKIGESNWIAYDSSWALLHPISKTDPPKEEEKPKEDNDKNPSIPKENLTKLFVCEKDDTYYLKLYKGEVLYIENKKSE